MLTEGRVIFTEFQNAGPMPSQVRPWQAEPHAKTQGFMVRLCGGAKRLPRRISLMSFSEVTIIT
jgi:hypothetical protein